MQKHWQEYDVQSGEVYMTGLPAIVERNMRERNALYEKYQINRRSACRPVKEDAGEI